MSLTFFSARRRAVGVSALAGAILALAACAPKETLPEPPPLPDGLHLSPVGYDALPGWQADAVVEALPALRRSCAKFSGRANGWLGPGALGGTVADWQELCADLDRAVPPDTAADEVAFRAVLESRLQPYAVRTDTGETVTGTFTGYYESELTGCRQQTASCTVPLYGPPPDLVSVNMGDKYPDMKGVTLVGRAAGTRILPYRTRAEIDAGALSGIAPVVAWATDPVEAHILSIQGSGRLTLPDGSVLRLGYAGNNGHPFKGVGRVMLDRGLLAPGQASMPAIRTWLKAHPAEAANVMAANPRYIFFRVLTGDGPIGAMGVALTPRRSLAVDTAYTPLGVPVWLATVDPDGAPLQRLMVAQDVGSAIKGKVRGDFFWGFGETAFQMAGRMKSPGTWYVLLPRARAPKATAGDMAPGSSTDGRG